MPQDNSNPQASRPSRPSWSGSRHGTAGDLIRIARIRLDERFGDGSVRVDLGSGDSWYASKGG
ncbi:MAG: hypothetical protein M8840_10685 [marine benthic group bacterium]|jgi:hypothetical protein|nr:hypothetical protein [Gemmatimonadota bacterium]MCL7991597.1 hypothetical protein [Gemmatimonadota bacterium]